MGGGGGGGGMDAISLLFFFITCSGNSVRRVILKSDFHNLSFGRVRIRAVIAD